MLSNKRKKKEPPLTTPQGPGLDAVNHVVLLMLENRSFDHMLGYLYTENGNVSPAGQPFDGLTGSEYNLDTTGTKVPVFQITPSTLNPYFMPGADPGEGYAATNNQYYGSETAPPSGEQAPCSGFIQDYAYTLGWEKTDGWSIVPGTTDADIMGCYSPAMLPVLSALAKGYAVCDQWFSSAPTETMPNRAFSCSGTSQGHMDDNTKTFTSPSIFGALTNAGTEWAIFGYDALPLTMNTFTDIHTADPTHFGLFTDFQGLAAAGTLPAFTFLEPSWGSTGNSQHPNYDVSLGEQFIHDVYEALRSGPGWSQTLLVLTYDEHGGCYDHVPPPWGATPPDNTTGEYGFGFDRFGGRVPTVLISPWIAPGTVYRVPDGSMPLDHTSILKVVEQRWNLAALTARDAAAPSFADVLTLTDPRSDDVLAGVTVPVSDHAGPSAGQVSHLEAIQEELAARFGPAPGVAASLDAAMATSYTSLAPLGAVPVVQDPDQRA
jgi:phospholipase C